MAGSMRDPFNLVKEELEESLLQVERLFREYERAPTPSLAKDLDDKCVSILWQVDELASAVRVSARDPGRYSLSAAEVDRRGAWVERGRQKAQGIRTALPAADPSSMAGGDLEMGARGSSGAATSTSSSTSLSNNTNGTRGRGSGPSHGHGRPGSDHSHDHRYSGLIRSEEQEQQQMLRKQDDELDALSTHVGRIGELGLAIGKELQEQDAILDEMNQGMDTTESRLRLARKKIQEVLKKTDSKTQCYIILGLLGVLVVLIFLTLA
jgi:hypothetical protein